MSGAAQASLSMVARSSLGRLRRAAVMFSSRWVSEDVPGMARVTGEWPSSQASAAWARVAPCRLAISSSAANCPAEGASPGGACDRSRPGAEHSGGERAAELPPLVPDGLRVV